MLGPLLFLVYVNDLFLSPFSQTSPIILYANDTTLLKPISTPTDLAEFQSDIIIIDAWFSNNHLNAAKSKVMVISTM